VNSLDACLASCIAVPGFGCEAVLWQRVARKCFRKTNMEYSKCRHDANFDMHTRTDTRFLAHPPPPVTSKISPQTCDALLSDPNGMLKQMWNKWGWRQLHDEEPCWGWDDPNAFFDNVINGGSCNEDWYEGSIGWQGFNQDAPGVLGFDDAIGWYCGNLPWGRRLDDDVGRNASDSRAGSAWTEEGHSEQERAHRRRMDDASRLCVDHSRNILMIFGNNVRPRCARSRPSTRALR
jgi:hypothetical protein